MATGFTASLLIVFVFLSFVSTASARKYESHTETYTVPVSVGSRSCSSYPCNYECYYDLWLGIKCYYKDTCEYCTTVYTTQYETKRKCQANWSGLNCDIPTCSTKCEEGQTCVPGNRCECLTSGGGVCGADINECTEGVLRCEHNCSNIAGSYTCRCNAGYRLRSDGHTCADINECAEGNVGCEHNCSNTDGSYSCSCNAGYRLTSDGHTCADIDECVQSPCDMQHKFTCQNTNGSYECVCEAGYKEVEPHECHDIDECDTLTNDCTLYENMTCENTIGSYKCVLRQGVNRNSTIIAVIVCVVVGIFLVIVAAVCLIKRGKTRLRNKQAADTTTTNTELAAEAVYCNVVKTTDSKSNESKMAKERQETEDVYEGLDLSNLQRENFYEALEKQPKTYAHVYDNATDKST